MDSPRRRSSRSPIGRRERRGGRSRSPRHRPRRSPSPRERRHRDYRSRSRSPASSSRKNVGNRDEPQPSRCLGVFGMGIYTTETELEQVFSKYGPLEKVQIVKDAKTARSRGFGFVYYESLEDAKQAKEQCSGLEIDGRRIRVDYSLTQRAHTPTPGIYMGRPTYEGSERSYEREREHDRYDRGYDRYERREREYRRSPSPYDRRYRSSRYGRSRSRSYSPRRY